MTDEMTVTGASSGDAGSAGTSPSTEVDPRVLGLQRAVSEKAQEAKAERERAAALERRLEALELAQMSEPERQGFLSQREQARMRELEAENERLKLAQKYPKVAPHFETIYKAQSAEEQMAYLQALLDPTPAAPQPSSTFSDVDPNNPMRSPGEGISVPPGSILNEADADRILALWGNKPMRSR